MVNVDLEYLKGFYPYQIVNDKSKIKHIVKEYIELLVLEHLTTLPYIKKLSFIGGTNLRLVKGIQRFSEDLDFDCKNFTKDEFNAMTNSIVKFLNLNGFNAKLKDNINEEKLIAYRGNIVFPELLYNLGLTGHKEEKFLLKIEAQDQGIGYNNIKQQINRNGYNIIVPSPPDDILCSMKLAALINRTKGRDFYDCMFLLQRTLPNLDFLEKRININSLDILSSTLDTIISKTNMNNKQNDFKHLLFNSGSEECINNFMEFFKKKINENSITNLTEINQKKNSIKL